MLTLAKNMVTVFGGLGIVALPFLYTCYKDKARTETFGQWLAGWFR